MSIQTTTIDDCQTVSTLFWDRVTRLPEKIALREKDFGIWNEYTWSDYGLNAQLAGLGLKALGLKRGDICSIASEVNKEWLFTDLGIIGVGGVSNGVYPTDAANQVEYLINDSDFTSRRMKSNWTRCSRCAGRPQPSARSSFSIWKACVISRTISA